MRHYFQDKSTNLGKRERTRSILIDGAIAAIAEHGIQGASIKEITSIAGLSNGTFYNHFEDREEIFRQAALSIAEETAADIAGSVSDVDDGIARIVLSTNEFITRMLDTPEWGAMIVDAVHFLGDVRQDVGRHLRADINLAQKQKQLPESPDRFQLHQIVALVVFAIKVQLEGGRSKSVITQTCETILRLLGLPPAKARKAVSAYLT